MSTNSSQQEIAKLQLRSSGSALAKIVGWSFVFGLIAYGAWWRFDQLDDRHLWLDEALSWRLAQLPVDELTQRTSEVTTVHPPLFFVILKCWILLVGDSEWCLRSLPCMLGVACIAAAYLTSRNLVKFLSSPPVDESQASFAGVVTAILFALNPFQMHLSQQVRGYTLAVFLCLLSTAALGGLLGSSSHRLKWAMLYVSTAALACYTHHLALLTVVAQGFFALCWARSPRGISQQSADDMRSCRRSLLGIAAAMVLLLVPLAIPLLRQTEAAADAWMRPIRWKDLSVELTEAFILNSSSPQRISPFVDVVSVTVLALLFLGCAFAAGWPGRCVALLGALPVWTLAVYSMIASRSLFDARYFAFAQCLWLVGGGVLCARIMPVPDRWRIVAVLALLHLQLPWLQRDDGLRMQHGIRTAIDQLKNLVKPEDLVIAVTPGVFFEASYYGRSGPVIRLLSETKERLKHEAAAHLDDRDLIGVEDVMTTAPQRIWILSMPAYDRAAERHLPLDHYSLVWKNRWKQDWNWERSVELLEYDRITGGTRSSSQ